jgi:hypothetical protein
MKIIDKKYVASITWESEPDSYDERLHKIGSQFSDGEDFIVINPIFDSWILDFIDTEAIKSNRCILWKNHEHWFIKKFPADWKRENGWRNISVPDTTDQLDVIFISYDELNAEENFQRLLTFAPNAKRVHGVKGIHQAHQAAARLAESDMFYVVDGDAWIIDDWNFSYNPKLEDRRTIHVWHSVNPVNGLEYGYGGVKLFPRKLLLENHQGLDLTTSLGPLRVITKISNITAFNTDPLSAWRAAFRECSKLSSGTISGRIKEENKTRLDQWTSFGADKPFGMYAIHGALAGAKYGWQNQKDDDSLSLINSREWIETQFKQEYND